MEVEPDLADRDDSRAPRQLLERRAVPRRIEVLRLVGMDADGREDAVVRQASAAARRESASVVPGTRNRVTPAARARSRSASAGGVSRPPSGDGSERSASTGRQEPPLLDPAARRHVLGGTSSSDGSPASPTDAARTMPSDSTPMSLAGFRFATTTTLRPDEGLRLVLRRDARDDLAPLAPEVHLAACTACWTWGRARPRGPAP